VLIVPFPFCVIITYDEDPSILVQLRTEEELRKFVAGNERPEIVEARQVRTMLRALEGEKIRIPGYMVDPSVSGVVVCVHVCLADAVLY
jgi:hypothetical protein